MNSPKHPELLNYMGFSSEIDTEMHDLTRSVPLYEDHLTFDEMVLGIREGKFFKGRLNVSRVNLSEASVTVEGLTNDLSILGLKNQNRAINGDIVCLQVLPESEWIRDFK